MLLYLLGGRGVRMRHIIYKDGVEENRIVADEEFCRTYYSAGGYSYERAPEPEPAPPEPEPTTEEILAVLLGEVNADGK